MKKSTLVIALLMVMGVAEAHFGSLLPNRAIVEEQKDADLQITAAFNHPMEQSGMNLVLPKSVSVIVSGQKTDVTKQLKESKVLDKTAWTLNYKVTRPGLYQFVMEPNPYWEASEDKFIVHYTKVMIPAFGEEGEWNEPVGLKTEIVPLTRPFGNYAGNSFRGKVLVDGKPVANTPVEVEYYNRDSKYQAPSDMHVTQVVMTDDQGIFSYTVPWDGWWGFAALTDADYKIKQDGADKDVELGAVLWTEFTQPIRK